jgi:hypothetical protein
LDKSCDNKLVLKNNKPRRQWVAKREYKPVYRPNLESNTQSALQDSQELYPEDKTDYLAD